MSIPSSQRASQSATSPAQRDNPVMSTCRLCLQERRLVQSHLLPKALYRLLRDPSRRDPNPVDAARQRTSSRQIVDRFLCSDCELLVSRFGEDPVLKWIRPRRGGGKSRLIKRLDLAVPYKSDGDRDLFSGASTGIDTTRFAYFAASIFWRAAVHDWPLGSGRYSTPIGSVRGDP